MEQIGILTKPQGVRGEFRVSLTVRSKTPVKKLKQIKISNVIYDVEKVVFRDGFVVIKVKGIDDRNSVELLRNSIIFGELDYRLNDDEVLIDDIIGFDVICGNEKLGTLKTVDDYGAGEIFVVQGKLEFMFPNVRNVIKNIDTDKKTIVLDKNIFEEIKVEN